MIGTCIIKNCEILSLADAVLPLDNLELTYGFGVYESLRLRHGQIYFLNEHIERLLNSARYIKLEHEFTAEKIHNSCEKLTSANKTTDAANVKILLIGGKTNNTATLYIFFTAPKFLTKKDYSEGVKVTTFPHERFLPQAKTLNMLPSYIAYRKARQSGAFDALFVDRSGMIREGTRSNFFAIRDKTLYTPPLQLVLDGVTRRTVIACAREHDFTVNETEIPLTEIFSFDSAFVTNTSCGIVPIRWIDSSSFRAIAPELIRLRKLYDERMAMLLRATYAK